MNRGRRRDVYDVPPPKPMGCVTRVLVWGAVFSSLGCVGFMVLAVVVSYFVPPSNNPAPPPLIVQQKQKPVPVEEAGRAEVVRQEVKQEAKQPKRLSAEVVNVRLVDFRTADWFDTKKVLVDWKNTGNRPVRAVEAKITALDGRGRVLERIPSYTIYAAAANDRPGVAPGETHVADRELEGFILPMDIGPAAVSATVEITVVKETVPW